MCQTLSAAIGIGGTGSLQLQLEVELGRANLPQIETAPRAAMCCCVITEARKSDSRSPGGAS
jgi:hypothetical protein